MVVGSVVPIFLSLVEVDSARWALFGRLLESGCSHPWTCAPHSVFADINLGSISDRWREKAEDAINLAELVKAVKLPPVKVPPS